MNDAARLFADARFLDSAPSLSACPAPTLPEVAFAGRSNAGKSSALNALTGRRGLARVSKTPGRTQMLNFFECRGLRLVDLPGYGFAKVPEAVRRKWDAMVGGYLQRREGLVGVVVLMDVRHPMTPVDRQMLAWAEAAGLPVLVLLTKADKLSRGRALGQLASVRRALGGNAHAELFSATTRLGVEAAQAHVAGWIAARRPGDPAP